MLQKAMFKLLVVYSVIVLTTGNDLTGNFQVCNLQCSNNGDPLPHTPASSPEGSTLIRGKSGPRGERGERGHRGAKGEPGVCDLSVINRLQQQLSTLQSDLNSLKQVQKHSEILRLEAPSNCKDILQANSTARSGVYQILVDPSNTIDVFCDMSDGGWTVFQRRFDGSTNFKQNYQSYRDGFGDVSNEYWLGLENLHLMTSVGTWELKVELIAYGNDEAYALYSNFQIGAGPGYRLHLGAYSGTAGDSLTRHSGMDFSTIDNDQDGDSSQKCALERTGSWWYKDCSSSNLNSFLYGNEESREFKMMYWNDFKGSKTPMKRTVMKIRPQ